MAEARLWILLNEIAKENDYCDYNIKVNSQSVEVINYTSRIYFPRITAPDCKDINLFAKVINMSEELMSKCFSNVFSTEIHFYTKLLKEYKKIEKKNCVKMDDELLVPKFYKCDTSYFREVIILENLTSRGFRNCDRNMIIDLEFAKSAVREMAKFHALSFAYLKENPKDFQKNLDKLTVMQFDQDAKDVMFVRMLSVALKIVKEANREKMENFFKKDRFQEFIDYHKPINHKVICHSDLWWGNLMYRQYNGKLQVMPIDYQLLRAGCPVRDLMTFMFTSTDSELRKNHYTDIIDYYYCQLDAALRRLNIDPQNTYTRQDYEDDLERLKMFGLLVSVTSLPLVTVDHQDMPCIGELVLNDLNIKPSSLFVRRLNGIVDDYIQWGLL